MEIVSLIISILSILISSGTLIYTWYVNKKNLKIIIDKEQHFQVKDDDKFFFESIIPVRLDNYSRNPITISSIQLVYNDKTINAIPVSFPYKGDSITFYNETKNYDFCTIELPLRLESYDNLETAILFYIWDKAPIYNNNIKSKIIFNTSRGQITKRITTSLIK